MTGCKGCSCNDPTSPGTDRVSTPAPAALVVRSDDLPGSVATFLQFLRAEDWHSARDSLETLAAGGATEGAVAGQELMGWVEGGRGVGVPLAVEALLFLGHSGYVVRRLSQLLSSAGANGTQELCEAIERGSLFVGAEHLPALFGAVFDYLGARAAEQRMDGLLPCIPLLVSFDVAHERVHQFLWSQVLADHESDAAEVATIALARTRPTQWLIDQLIVAVSAAHLGVVRLALYIIESLPGPVDALRLARVLHERPTKDWKREPLRSILSRPRFSGVIAQIERDEPITPESTANL